MQLDLNDFYAISLGTELRQKNKKGVPFNFVHSRHSVGRDGPELFIIATRLVKLHIMAVKDRNNGKNINGKKFRTHGSSREV